MAVIAPAELHHNHDVNINDLVPITDTPVDLVPYDQEIQYADGWMIWFLQLVLHFVLKLALLVLWPLSDSISTEIYPYVDIIPEEKSYFWDYVWDTMMILVFLIFVAGTYLMDGGLALIIS